MFKKIFFLISLLSLFFISIPINSYALQDTSNSTVETNPWINFWNTILSWFGIVQGTNKYISKDIKIKDPSENYDYNSSDFDITTRAVTSKDQEIHRGIYLNQLIHQQNGYQDTSYSVDGCDSIKLTQMVYYFYTQNQKILYDTNQNLLEYDQNLMEKYKTDINSPESCYTTVYNQSPSVPQGTYQDKSNAAPATSTQLNSSIRMIIPASAQGGDIPTDNTNTGNAEAIVKDTDKQEETMLKSFMPNSHQTSPNFSTDRDDMRNDFAFWLHPDSWDDDESPERDENTPLVEMDPSLDGSRHCTYNQKCNGIKSHCRGMSQYGAYGMAKSGKTYEEILKFYYGDIAFSKIDTTKNIKVRIDRADAKCSSGQTISLNFEIYLTALGEMSDEWGKKGMEALKAQAIAARTYAYIRTAALANSICNTANCQVFRCSDIGKRPNLSKAVQATAGIIMVDANTKKLFLSEYARSFCGPSVEVKCDNHTIPSVNSAENIKYEKIGHPKNLYCKNPV